ncbi:MAG: hypothetical protein O8C64_15165 [Candidatus Methanoperedens sp.]|nr:hypothetical protein [Candidatus Methanoperedens sp.]MCZ7403832.1 hypothetical protein [Candidatus Methanoperedens sp.]
MEKLIVQYPNLRSTTSKYDPCTRDSLAETSEKCQNCRVFVIADRFLGNDFMDKVMHNRYSYPYVLIADTVGCNLRCWFCYSHHYWTRDRAEKKGCRPLFISSEKLADQFICKIEKLAKTSDMKNRPFTRLRISGGEPIYATNEELRPFISDKPIDYKAGIDFWLDYFKHLNNRLDILIQNKTINVMLKSEWTERSPWPSFIGDSPGRVNMRFDTNGIAFGSGPESKRVLGGKDVADYFIDGLYKLYKEGNLSRINVSITYSLKGTTPNEYYWSQRKNLPVDVTNIGLILPIEEHPQISGIKNLMERINRYSVEDEKFLDCVDITIEKGINHDLEHYVYLYNPEALNWKEFQTQSGIEMSEVKNDINIIYRFGGGQWGVLNRTPGLAKRYFDQGAEIQAISEDGEFTGKDNYASAKELSRFIEDHHNDRHFQVIIRPKSK